MVTHIWARGARIEAGGGLVEKQQRQARDQACRQIQASTHATGEVLQRFGRGLDQIELLEEFQGLGARIAAAQAEQPREDHEVLGRRQILVDGGVLAGDADQGSDRGGFTADVVAEDARLTAVGAKESGEHADGGGLAGAVRPEDAEHRAGGDGEADAVDRAVLAELLDESVGLDGKRRSCVVHGMKLGRPILHGPCVELAVTCTAREVGAAAAS